MKTRREIAREIEQRLERAWSSPHAEGVRRPDRAPKAETRPPAAAPAVSLEVRRLAAEARSLNGWLSLSESLEVGEAMARMRPQPAVPKRRSKGRRDVAAAPLKSVEPADEGTHQWWRTVAGTATTCDQCRQGIPTGDRFLYRHSSRSVVCRMCAGDDRWQDARPSKKLRAHAERSREERRSAA